MSKRKSKQSRFQIARGFRSETPLERTLGTGDIDRATRSFPLSQSGTATTIEPEKIAATTTAEVAEEAQSPTEDIRAAVAMTNAYVIDKWLTRWEWWVLYVAGPFLLYVIAAGSGNLKTSSEFIWITSAGIVVTLLILIVKKCAKAS